MSTINRYLCGTPDEFCTGGVLKTDQMLQHKKCHNSPQDAFNCYARYLVKVLKFERIGPREFKNPENNCIRTLTKKTRFGGRLRMGKGEEKRISASRFMPDVHNYQGIIY